MKTLWLPYRPVTPTIKNHRNPNFGAWKDPPKPRHKNIVAFGDSTVHFFLMVGWGPLPSTLACFPCHHSNKPNKTRIKVQWEDGIPWLFRFFGGYISFCWVFMGIIIDHWKSKSFCDYIFIFHGLDSQRRHYIEETGYFIKNFRVEYSAA